MLLKPEKWNQISKWGCSAFISRPHGSTGDHHQILDTGTQQMDIDAVSGRNNHLLSFHVPPPVAEEDRVKYTVSRRGQISQSCTDIASQLVTATIILYSKQEPGLGQIAARWGQLLETQMTLLVFELIFVEIINWVLENRFDFSERLEFLFSFLPLTSSEFT